jgi:hypothetical protein
MSRRLQGTALTVLGMGAIFIGGVTVIVGLIAMGARLPKPW